MFKIKIYFYNDDTFQSEMFETIADSVDESIKKVEDEKPYLFDFDWCYEVVEIKIVADSETPMMADSFAVYQSKINDHLADCKKLFNQDKTEIANYIMDMYVKRLMSSVFKMVKGL